MNIIPFEPGHVGRIDLQARQKLAISTVTAPYLIALKGAGPAASAEHDGRIIACAGVAVLGFGIGTMWAFCAGDGGRYFVRFHRCLKRLLEIPDVRRIEATAECDFEPACRWLEMLGFQFEGVMRRYGPDGADHRLYGRV